MIQPQEILDLLSRTVIATPSEDGVRVSTHVLYPSNGAVTVTVRGGAHTFIVYDDGGAIGEMISAGIRTVTADRMLRARVKNRGLIVHNGVIRSPEVSVKGIPAAILLVANASKDVAEWALDHLKFRVTRNFKEDLAKLLGRYFNESLTNDIPILGESNKTHKFTYVVNLKHNRRALIDPVLNDPSSINSRVVANLDVKNMRDPNIIQLIVYDDSLHWPASDLRLLQIGAPTLPFSHAEPEIRRLAA